MCQSLDFGSTMSIEILVHFLKPRTHLVGGQGDGARLLRHYVSRTTEKQGGAAYSNAICQPLWIRLFDNEGADVSLDTANQLLTNQFIRLIAIILDTPSNQCVDVAGELIIFHFEHKIFHK